MTTVRCPRCHDEVTMPPRAGKQTHVRCPLCLEDYLLEEALRQSPPMLEVIGGELEPAYAAAPAAYSGANDFDAGLSPAGHAEGGLSFAPEAPATDVFGTTGPAMGEAAVAPAGGIRASTRPRRKQKSALGTIVGVVLGGGLGVALAPIVIWWVAGTDPFELAPKVPAALQFVLPAKLRTQGGSSSVASNTNPPLTNNSRPAPMTTPMPQPTNGEPGDLLSGAPTVPEVMPADPLANVDPLPTKTTPDENPEPATEPVKPATNTTDVPPATATNVPPATTDPPAVDDRKATDLIATLTSARGAADEYANADRADKDELKRLAVALYEAACQLGPQVVTLNLDDPAIASVKEQVQEFVTEQASTPGKINTLGFLANKRLDDPSSPPGILLSGKVTAMQSAGTKFATTIAVGKAMREVVVLTSQNPQDNCNVDDTVVVLGSVERDPSRLKGYEGTAEMVVAAGYLQKVE